MKRRRNPAIIRPLSVLVNSVAFTLCTSCAGKKKEEPPPPQDSVSKAADDAAKANDALAEEAAKRGKEAEGFWKRMEKSWDKRF